MTDSADIALPAPAEEILEETRLLVSFFNYNGKTA